MEKLTYKISFSILVLFAMIFNPGWLQAESVEGRVQGFICATQGIYCPIGKEDPKTATERVFGVLTKDRKYYFVPNVDRAVLLKHVNDQVKIFGTISTKYVSINASKIEVLMNGTWRTAWPFKDEKKEIGS